MKVLIWILCFALFSISSNFAKEFIANNMLTSNSADVAFNYALTVGIVTVLMFTAYTLLAKYLCKKWDQRKSSKKNDKENQEIDINPSNEVQNYKTEENPYFFKNEDSLSTENYSSTPNIQNSTDKTLEKPKKQKSSNIKTKVLAATTTILALTTIALSVGMVIQNQEMSSIVEDYEERLDKSEDLNETYQNKISNYSKMVNTLQSDLNFYTSQVVFVCNNSPYYHKPHCEYFNSKSFKIYLKREANSLGYDYCPYCFDY